MSEFHIHIVPLPHNTKKKNKNKKKTGPSEDPLGYWTLFGPKTRAGTGSQYVASGANSGPAVVDYLSAIQDRP